MSNGNYSCNRAVIFEVVLFFCYLYFGTTASQQPQPHLNNHNRISTTTPSPPQRQPRHLLTISSTTSPRTNNIASPSSPLHRHLFASHGESHGRAASPPTDAGADDFYNLRVLRMISATSAHVRVSRRDRIKMTKGAEPEGGERLKVEDQTHPRTP